MTKEEETKDGSKVPSKKELKKLAKKAEKDAKKSGATAAAASSSKIPSNDTNAPPPPRSPPAFFIHKGNGNCPATLKASITSIATGIKLIPARDSPEELSLLKAGLPAISNANNEDDDVVFGGNGICMALSLIGGSISVLGGGMISSEMDEWLEWEKTVLRGALLDGDVNALSKLEKALESCGGLYLVGNSLSIVDISIVTTIYHSTKTTPLPLPPHLSTYLSHHTKSPLFTKGIANASNLEPPSPLDPTDPSMMRAVKHTFETALYTAFPQALVLDIDGKKLAERCKSVKFGDYQCTIAMSLFGVLKKSGGLPSTVRSPMDVAEAIKSAIPSSNPVLDGLVVNKPGFLMSRVKASYLETHMNAMISGNTVQPPRNMKVENVVVDFSSPNIAKEMHVGHLRSTIIGESVCRILEYSGCKVERMNHVGDWGTQFGMLIQYLKEEFPDFKDCPPNITDLTEFYKNAKTRFDENPQFKKTAQLNVVKLQSGDVECHSIWNILCDISRREFKKVYDRLDVSIDEYGESFYNSRIPPVIAEFDAAGLIRVEEGGAKCVFVNDDNIKIPLMLQKSDGGFGYDSTDMAALKYRLQELNATRIIVITDFTQTDHFKMCYLAANMIGWVQPQTHRLEHIAFGTVQGEDGKRFRTRSGDTVRLVDLLDEAVHRMETSLEQRIKENKASITLDQVPATAAVLGYGAVKYFDLRRNPASSYEFSYDRMLDTKGNTAIYLLYAHARLESICTKAKKDHGVDVEQLIKKGVKIALTQPPERNLALHLQLFADTLDLTLEDMLPYHICDFIYAASIAASDFVTQCRVLGSPEMESRLLLCRSTAIVMRKCFDLLGIRYVMSI
eukprot:CAMPEP_0195507194 /NCGR_PEP_ID=MMETSP0794_2-20130614/696_1 /TAXON_ID=515487 /ORGANISM="Stephanopyxis turris, Strain CCMP 815" /LENGTH=846 /DNA_ID=CAMNT_0040633797 /DNA_START=174 /DNA_END=2714 /DNA_ORIENTATION=+